VTQEILISKDFLFIHHSFIGFLITVDTQQWHSLAMHQRRAEALQVVREGHVGKKLTSLPGGEGVKS
jgi:hypothetical protein